MKETKETEDVFEKGKQGASEKRWRLHTGEPCRVQKAEDLNRAGDSTELVSCADTYPPKSELKFLFP